MNGEDTFVFGRGGGKDVIIDFDAASDRILLEFGIGLAGAKVGDVNGDGKADLTLAFSKGGGSAVLLGVNSLAGVEIVQAADLLSGGATFAAGGGEFDGLLAHSMPLI